MVDSTACSTAPLQAVWSISPTYVHHTYICNARTAGAYSLKAGYWPNYIASPFPAPVLQQATPPKTITTSVETHMADNASEPIGRLAGACETPRDICALVCGKLFMYKFYMAPTPPSLEQSVSQPVPHHGRVQNPPNLLGVEG